MSDELRAADALEKAADLIEVNGHARGQLRNLEGAYCAMGALNMATTGTAYYTGLEPIGRWYEFRGKVGVAINAVFHHLGLKAHEPVPVAGPYGDELLPEVNCRVRALVYWNNAEERTGAEVIDAFRHAAKDLRNEATSA